MTQEQILNEIQAVPLVAQASLLEKISQNIRESILKNQHNYNSHFQELSVKQRAKNCVVL